MLASIAAVILLLFPFTSACPGNVDAVFADMHDGDKKEIIISGSSLIIKPSGNNQTWIVRTELDEKTCSAVVDFHVPGKPNPPPVNLTATLWYAKSDKGVGKIEIEFTDPTGKLPAGPLNRWIMVTNYDEDIPECPTSLHAIYADMHDGDMKQVSIFPNAAGGSSIEILPHGNNQTWLVKSTVDSKSCSALINFNVPGKPGPPPVDLLATLWSSGNQGNNGKRITEFIFTDPSGTLAEKDFPLNDWVEIKEVKIV